MQKLMSSFKRIWQSLRRITSSLTGRITQGTGSVAKAVGSSIGLIMAFLVMICLAVVIMVAAIPYGIFGESKTSHNNIVDAEFTPIQDFCINCGVELHEDEGVQKNGRSYCKECSNAEKI